MFAEHLDISECKVVEHNGSQAELFLSAIWPARLPAFRAKEARVNYNSSLKKQKKKKEEKKARPNK